MTDQKTTGRPRLYNSSSERMEAFRKRQETAGYTRKEVLTTSETNAAIATLAKMHGVTTGDVASSLLELGLSTYTASVQPPSPALAHSSFAGAMGATLTQSSDEGSEVIQNFFNRRKNIKNDN